MPGTGKEESMQLAETLRNAVMALGIKHIDSDIEEIVTISIGVATTEVNPGGNDILMIADRALYVAKQGGRNRVEFISGDE